MRGAKFARVGLGYALSIADVGTDLYVGRLSMSRGELSGELSVACSLPAITSTDGHLFRGRVNLSSTRSRSDLAKYLDGRAAGSGINWRDLLEWFFVRVLESESAGAEVVRIGRRPTQIGPTFRLDPMLPLSKPTILFGDGGVGKSYMAVGIAVSVVSGREVIPGFRPRTCPVLYLDWETDADDIDARVKAVSAGVDIEPPELDYINEAGPLTAHIEELARHVTAAGTGLIIIDSMAGALGATSEIGDANESVVRLFTALRHLNTTVLVIDHISKEGAASESGAFKPYGSAYKVNLARSVWELRQGKEADVDAIHLGLYHRKSNNSRLAAPMGLAYRNEDGKRVTWSDEPITETSLAAGVSIARRVDAAVKEGPITDAELADALGVEVKAVRVPLSRGR